MILQALVSHYEDLQKQGKISSPGWGEAKVSFGLNLSREGEPIGLLPLRVTRQEGKKVVDIPRILEVPQPVKRTVGILPNFLCDNSTYIFGLDDKGKPQRSAQCFQACGERHHELLDVVETVAAKAILNFFDTWNPEKFSEYPFLEDSRKELMAGANILFYIEGQSVLEDEAIRMSWQEHYIQSDSGVKGVCMVTGQETSLERLHPAIKGVMGAQATGASLVSFNAPAFCSYEKEQGENASVGKYAAFAYGTALNALLSDREHTKSVGDTTVVYWVEGGEEIYQKVTCAALFGADEEGITDRDLSKIFDKLRRGERVQIEDEWLDPEKHFYILGLAPNVSRLVVRFFLMDSFGNMLEHVAEHYKRLEIVKPDYDRFELLPIWKLLSETVNNNARDKSPSPQMAADTLQAVLTGRPYPVSLLNGAMMRIRVEREVTRGRAAIIKAYYSRNPNRKCPEEVLKMELNEQCTNVPYTLGRLFSLLEQIQQTANPGINATIKDKYFNAAASTPANIFPVLMNLAQKHLRKMNEGQKIYFDRQIGELSAIIGEAYPTRMTLPEQGAFQLGYYCQTQKRYQKKEEK